MSRCRVVFPEEDFRRPEQFLVSIARVGGCGGAGGGRRAEPRQRLSAGLDVFVSPKRRVKSQGFAPIRHDEGRVDFAGLNEGGVRVFVFEMVKCGQSSSEEFRR